MAIETPTEASQLPTYSYAFLDELSKKAIRRATLKAVAIPGYQVPFGSRELPIARGWGTGGLQLTLSLIGPGDCLKVIDQGADNSVNAVNIRRLVERTAPDVDTTTLTEEATIIQSRHRLTERPLRSDQIMIYQVPMPEPLRAVERREAESRRMHGEDDPRHGVRHHILHRLDVRTPDPLAQALPTLSRASAPYASLNDHTPGQGQYRDVQRLIRLAHAQADQRNGTRTDPSWYEERMRRAQDDTESVQRFYAIVGKRMTTSRLVLSTHDDDTVAKVDEQLRLGATVAEFPVTFEAAEHSRAHNMQIVVGAPNIVRGGSQSGNLNAADLVARGLADIICADYHSPSLLPAAWRLVRDGLVDLPAAIRMLTLNPARAVGLHDRGAIAIGQLADLCIVRVDAAGWPHCEGTIVGGMSGFRFARHPEGNKPQPQQPAWAVTNARG